MNLNSPVVARLTPEGRRVDPDLLTTLRSDITGGIPHRIEALPNGISIILTVATGQIRTLMTSPGDQTVAESAPQRTAAPGRPDLSAAMLARLSLAESRARAAPRLVFLENNRFIGQTPLVTGVPILISTPSQPQSAGLWIEILGWVITASAMVGVQATGSWIELGWRSIRDGQDSFDSVVLRPELRQSLSYRRNLGEDGPITLSAEAEAASDDPETLARAGGLDWRLLHDRT